MGLQHMAARVAETEAVPSGPSYLMVRNYTHGDRENPMSLVESKAETATTVAHLEKILELSADGGKIYYSDDGDGRLAFGVLFDPASYEGEKDQWGVPAVSGAPLIVGPADAPGVTELDVSAGVGDAMWGEELGYTFTGMENGEEFFDWLRDPAELALIEESTARPDMIAIGFDGTWVAEQVAAAGTA